MQWKPSDVFYDLGSGDGMVVFLAEKLGAPRAVGFERMHWTHFWAKLKAHMRKSRAEFRRENFFEQPWNDATVLYTYLYPPLMGKVEEKFLAECAPGTTLIIRDFPLPNLKPDEVVDFRYPHNAFIYRR